MEGDFRLSAGAFIHHDVLNIPHHFTQDIGKDLVDRTRRLEERLHELEKISNS